jgi:hypothetical protein
MDYAMNDPGDFLPQTETTVPIVRGPGEGIVVGVLRDQSTFKVLSEETGGMPRKSTGLTNRLTLPMRPELLREIDQVRGDVPRVAWIRRELALAVTRQRPRPRKRDGKSK